jgi:hypothetical protein
MFSYVGELERIFLVLREKVALRRLQRDEQDGNQPQPPPINQPPAGVPGPSVYQIEPPPGQPPRGTKRTSDDASTQNEKRMAV